MFVWMTSPWSINLLVKTPETWSFDTYSSCLSQGSHRSVVCRNWCEFESVLHLSRVDNSRGRKIPGVCHRRAAQSAYSFHLCISSSFSRSYSSVGRILDIRFQLRFRHHWSRLSPFSKRDTSSKGTPLPIHHLLGHIALRWGCHLDRWVKSLKAHQLPAPSWTTHHQAERSFS